MESHYREFRQYFKEHGFLKSVSYFIGKVRTGGDWELKSQSDWGLSKDKEYVYNGTAIRSDEPGNIHFGYVGSVIFDAEMFQAGAGIYQIFFGNFHDWVLFKLFRWSSWRYERNVWISIEKRRKL